MRPLKSTSRDNSQSPDKQPLRIWVNQIQPKSFFKLYNPIESTKTTSKEDVSTGVLEKIKNI